MDVKILSQVARVTAASLCLATTATAFANEVVYATDRAVTQANMPAAASDAVFAGDSAAGMQHPVTIRAGFVRPIESSAQQEQVSNVIVDRFVQPAAGNGPSSRFTAPSPSGLKLRSTRSGGSVFSNLGSQRKVRATQAPTPKSPRQTTAADQRASYQRTSNQRIANQRPSGLQSTRPAGPVATPGDFSNAEPNGNVRIARFDENIPTPHAMPAPPHPVAIRNSVAIDASEIDRIVSQPNVDPADQLVVEAHQLSLSADSPEHYTEIARLCAEALQQCKHDQTRMFAKQLAAWALNRRGAHRTDLGESALALADFEAAITLDDQSWRPVHNRSVTHAQAGRFAEAFDDVSRVIEMNPNFAKAYSNRATLYVQAEDLDLALADYDRALEIDPSLVAAHVGRGRVCHMLGRLQEALDDLDSAIEHSEDNAEIICSRADLHADLGDYEAALVDYATAVGLNPEFAHAYRNGAWLMATCPDERYRDVETALFGAQQAIDCDYGQRHAALDTLAAAQANAGDFEEAVHTLREAIKIAPDEALAAYHERLELYRSGRPYRSQPVASEQ